MLILLGMLLAIPTKENNTLTSRYYTWARSNPSNLQNRNFENQNSRKSGVQSRETELALYVLRKQNKLKLKVNNVVFCVPWIHKPDDIDGDREHRRLPHTVPTEAIELFKKVTSRTILHQNHTHPGAREFHRGNDLPDRGWEGGGRDWMEWDGMGRDEMGRGGMGWGGMKWGRMG